MPLAVVAEEPGLVHHRDPLLQVQEEEIHPGERQTGRREGLRPEVVRAGQVRGLMFIALPAVEVRAVGPDEERNFEVFFAEGRSVRLAGDFAAALEDIFKIPVESRLVIAEEGEDDRPLPLAELADQEAQRVVGGLHQGFEGDRVREILKLRVDRDDLHAGLPECVERVAAVVLHGDVENEERVFIFIEHAEDFLVVRAVVGVAEDHRTGLREAAAVDKLLKAHGRVDLVAVPVPAVFGVHRDRAVALKCELGGHRRMIPEIILDIGDRARDEDHGIAGQVFELGPGGAAAARRDEVPAVEDRAGVFLHGAVKRNVLPDRVERSEDAHVGEGLVHDGEEDGLLRVFIFLLRGVLPEMPELYFRLEAAVAVRLFDEELPQLKEEHQDRPVLIAHRDHTVGFRGDPGEAA